MSQNKIETLSQPKSLSPDCTVSVIIGLFICAAWSLLYPYAGIVHDARLYTLQALAHLQPDTYGRDIFLRFGSQDQFTLFTPAYAWLCTQLGIEHAAALLTLVGQIAFLSGCGWLARQFLSRHSALIALSLIVIFPGNYGADFVFTYLETFVTPRIYAEALALGAMAALLTQRRMLCAVLLTAALAVHPIMAMAGIVFVVMWIAVHLLTPRTLTWSIITVLMLAIVFGLLAPVLSTVLGRNLQFDNAWLNIVDGRSPYLFLHNWNFSDWARSIVPCATLLLSALFLPAQSQLARAGLLSALAGLTLTFIGADLFKLVLITQGQAWRWLWLSTLLAVLLLPALIAHLWTRNVAGKTVALLLIIAWFVRNEPSSIGLSVLVLWSGIALWQGKGTPSFWRSAWMGTCTLLAATVLYLFASTRLTTGWLIETTFEPRWFALLRRICSDGLLPFAILLGATYALRYSIQRSSQLLIAAALALCCTTSLFVSWPIWWRQQYPQTLVQNFAEWRKHIPEHAEVLWIDGPVPTWLLLQRPSYISSIQTTATLFSREAAMALKQRASELDAALLNEHPLLWESVPDLKQPLMHSLHNICAQVHVNFLVSRQVFDEPAVASIQATLPGGLGNAFLYQCQREQDASS